MLVSLGLCALTAGCGDGDEEQDARLDDLWANEDDSEANDWVVEGMSCDGEDVVRLVEVVDEDSGPVARYIRGDECIDAGDLFWNSMPQKEGDSVQILMESESQRRVAHRVEGIEEYGLRLIGSDDGDELEMRQVYRPTGPTPIPELSDFDLAGTWWMEGYLCIEELVPQLVRIIHPPGSLHMTKIRGDACIGDGANFLDAQLSGTSVSGEAHLEEPSEFGFDDDEHPILEVSGTVRTEHFIGLAIDGQAVSLRRVMTGSAR